MGPTPETGAPTATIVEPAATRAIAVGRAQQLRLVADAATDWWARTNGGAWAQINPGAPTAELVWSTPTTVERRWTFDALQVAAEDTEPDPGHEGGPTST